MASVDIPNTVDGLRHHVRQMQRDWLSMGMEGFKDSEEERQNQLEDYLAAEKMHARLREECEQLKTELGQRKSDHEEALKKGLKDCAQLLEICEQEMAVERSCDRDPFGILDALKGTCHEREDELQHLYQEIEKAEKEDTEVKQRLRELQQRAPNMIPVIIKEKDEILLAMEEAWETEKRRIIQLQGALEKQQQELAWHLNRGSYIKQPHKDPRVLGQFGNLKGEVEVHENRLVIWEQQLIQENLDYKAQSEDYKLRKLQLAAALNKSKEDYEGTRKKIGTKQVLQDQVDELKSLLVKESKKQKELVNTNAELKNLKRRMEDEIKGQRKTNAHLFDQYQRAQLAVRTTTTTAALEERRKPLAITRK